MVAFCLLSGVSRPVLSNAFNIPLRAAAFADLQTIEDQWQMGDRDHESNPVARVNGHDPYAYLKEVLMRLPTQGASAIEQLLPHQWTPA